MKKAFKSIVAVIIIILVTAMQTFALATKQPPKEVKVKNIDRSSYSYYEDFTAETAGSVPKSFINVSTPADTSVYVVKEKTEDGIEKNMVKFDDRSSANHMYAETPLNQKSSKILIEVKFKLVRPKGEVMTVSYDIYGDKGVYCARVMQSVGGTVINAYSNGIYSEMTPGGVKPDVWYTLQMLVDRDNQTFDTQMESSSLVGQTTRASTRYDAINGVVMAKSMPLITDSYDKSATKLRIRTTSGTGELLIDYITVTEKINELEWKGVKPKPIELPMILTPAFNFKTGSAKNISINGNYVYFVNIPIIENETVYAPVREISSAMGFKLGYADASYILSGKNTSASISAKNVTVGGINAPAVTVIDRGGVMYVNITEFAKALGYDVSENESGDIIIKGKKE